MDAGGNWFDVQIDGRWSAAPIATDPNDGLRVYVLASGLSPTLEHTVRVVKRTEASYFLFRPALDLRVVTLEGLLVPPGAVVARPRNDSRLRIEVFGDSDSNGFGILGLDSYSCVEDLARWEDCRLGWAYGLADALNAQLHVEAWSGKGVVKNAVGVAPTSPDPMPIYWNRTLATVASDVWNFSAWRPHLLVVLLGSNDFFMEPYPPAVLFESRYVSLLETITAAYDGNVTLANVCGGLSSGPIACGLIQPAVQRFQQLHPLLAEHVHYIHVPDSLLQYPQDYGCLDHRNVVGQSKLLNYLLTALPLNS